MINKGKLAIGAALTSVFALLILLIVWGPTREAEGEEEKEQAEEEQAIFVAITPEQLKNAKLKEQEAAPGQLVIKLNLPGKIVFDPQRYAHIVPTASGIVKEARKIIGDPVAAGEVIAVIESRDMAEAKAAYLAAIRKEALASNILQREKVLRAKQIGPEQDYLQAEATAEEAKIELERTKQHLYALGLSQHEINALPYTSAIDLRKLELKSPLNGTVIDRHLTIGENVDGTQEAFVIADLKKLWVELNAYQKDLALLKEGLALVIIDEVGSRSPATLIRINPVVDTASSRIVAIAEIDNSSGKWRPGQYVRGVVEAAQLDASVSVPRESVMKIDNQDCVFVCTPEGYEKRDVVLGPKDDKNIWIVEGLAPGEKFVSKNAYILKFEMTKGEPD